MTTTESPNVAVAFGLVIGAGAATAIGAAVVFFPSLVKLASRRVLAGALGLSAGVMTYVSFVEIFKKSNLSFLNAGHSEQMAYVYATLCFFGGVVTMMLIDLLVKCLSGGHHHYHEHHEHHHKEEESCHSNECESEVDFVTVPHCACVDENPLEQLDEWKRRANEEVEHKHQEATGYESDTENMVEQVYGDLSDTVEMDTQKQMHNEPSEKLSKADVQQDQDDDNSVPKPPASNVMDEEMQAQQPSDSNKSTKHEQDEEHERRKLVHMGINTAIAIGLHNFPEGLATFVAALNDARVGAVLAVAIGIHNIPEGLCVALPIYYATGNRRKAFVWACISGISEPFAALLGWAVLANNFSDDLYAVLFGVVAGMMVIISTKELLPTAHRYDPDDTVVTYSYIGGMCVMALSLVLFVL
jgi:ZIP family zinc transporter